jgi:hypothetical protein
MDLGTLQRAHPEWRIVDYKEAPNGGLWALGADGGVFALDATGGTTGLTAPFLGAYTGHPEWGGPRQFTRIDTNQSGGYTLVSANQEGYGFNAPSPAPPVAAPAASTTGTQQATGAPVAADPLSGSAAIHAVLDPLGLGDLAGKALEALHSQPGATAEYITTVWLPQQQSYKDRFPEITHAQDQNAKGIPTHIPTAAEIVTYHNTVQGMVDQGLLPPEFAAPDKVTKLINGGVSAGEFQDRVLSGYDKFMHADPADQAAFLAYHPAVDIAHAVGSILDPGLGQAAVDRIITQAQIGGSAIRSGYGPISAGQATSLEQAGLTGASAQSGLTNLALEKPLFANTAGETMAGSNISQDTQLGSLTGNAADIATIEGRRATRKAAFSGGGGAASGGTGRQGIGGSGQ